MFSFYGDGYHRELHVLTHSFPTRSSSDLQHRHGNARRIGKREVALRRHRLGGDDLDFSRPSRRMEQQCFTFRKMDVTSFAHLTPTRSEEHTSELQSLMRTSYAVFCLKKKQTHTPHIIKSHT